MVKRIFEVVVNLLYCVVKNSRSATLNYASSITTCSSLNKPGYHEQNQSQSEHPVDGDVITFS
jgi:hypothetical protein